MGMDLMEQVVKVTAQQSARLTDSPFVHFGASQITCMHFTKLVGKVLPFLLNLSPVGRPGTIIFEASNLIVIQVIDISMPCGPPERSPGVKAQEHCC